MKRASARLAAVGVIVVFALVGCKKETPSPSTKKAPAAAAEAPEAPPAEDAATAIIERAVTAAGGAEALEKNLSAATIHSKGKYLGGPYTMATYWQAPDKIVMSISDGGFVMAYVGDQCWHAFDDVVVDCPPEEAASGIHMTQVGNLTNLYPLLKGDWKLEKLDDADLEGTQCHVVRVSEGGLEVPVDLFFDAETALLKGAAFEQKMMGKTVRSQLVVEGYHEEKGIQVPTGDHMIVDGKLLMNEEYGEIEFGQADVERFTRPPMGATGQASVKSIHAHKALATTVKGPYAAGIGAGIGKLMAWMGANDAFPMGPPTMVWLKDPTHTENPAEYETEIRFGIGVLGEGAKLPDGIELKDVLATKVVRSLEIGPMEKVAARYGELAAWAVEHGYEVTGPAGMDSYSNPADTPPDKLVNVLWLPVAKKGPE